MRLLPLVIGATLFTPVLAQAELPPLRLDDAWELRVQGQVRPRYNADLGRDFVADDSAERTLVTQRARLGATLGHASGVAIGVQLQDVRVWGEEADTLNTFQAKGFDVHEAWAKLPLHAGLSAKVGRQEMVLDNHRLVGNVDWTQRARAFDGVVLALDGGALDVTALYARVNERFTDADGNVADDAKETDFGGAHLAYAFAGKQRLALVYLVNARHTDDEERHTFGANVSGTVAGITYGAEAYYQLGELAGADVDAYMAALRGGYALDTFARPSVTLFGEYLSGDGTTAGTFDTLYATNHKFYGELDVFTAIPRHTAGLGLVDAGVVVTTAPIESLRASVDYHHFRPAKDARDTRFGDEIDVKLAFTGIERVTVGALYGVFFPEGAIRAPNALAPDTRLVREQAFFLTVDVVL